jgi:hypothetical protein
MKTYVIALRMSGEVISIEITDGHGAWALGKQTTFGYQADSPVEDCTITIDERSGLCGSKISLQSGDVNTSVTTVIELNVTTSLNTLTVQVTIATGELVKVKGPNDEFIDQGTGTWTHVLQLA